MKPLPLNQHLVLAALLDFGGCTNAMLDNKDYHPEEIRRTRRILEEAGLTLFVQEFQQRLCELERRRPRPHEDDWQFRKIRAYREDVVRLLLGTIAASVIGNHCIEEGIRATYCDDDLKILFRLVMQFQVIDDILDYTRDISAGLPTFLTASASLHDAIRQTHQAVLRYSRGRDISRSGDLFPLRVALFLGSSCANLMLRRCR